MTSFVIWISLIKSFFVKVPSHLRNSLRYSQLIVCEVLNNRLVLIGLWGGGLSDLTTLLLIGSGRS
jgi:hypothetical protein